MAKRIGAAGVLLVVAGGALFATAISASAATATLTLTPGPSTGYTNGQLITIDGSGFTPKAEVYIFECSDATGQPTISVLGQSMPVSCTQPIGAGKATATGTFKQPLPAAVIAGVTGPPATGNDSAGTSAGIDAANYPCPQYAGQSGGCAFFAFDSKGVAATSVPFSFDPSVPIPTTTTTVPATVVCNKTSATATSGGASVTVDPATCLTSGTLVSVTGSGFTGTEGAITECSATADEPTVSLAGEQIPVSCSDPISHVITLTGSGSFSSTFTVATGTVGPPLTGVDSAGNQASADAAKYQCPEDVTTGAGCTIGFGDSPTQAVVVPITFVPNNPGQPTSSGGGTGASTAASGSASPSVTKASSSSLAFTGPGTGLRWMGEGGVVLVILGAVLVAVADRPRRLVHKLSRPNPHSRRS
jgi:hypothetical protein